MQSHQNSQSGSTPSRIRVLPRAVAERIAAGEVIERPASVVKELVENSLDAGATEVAVILEDGGKALIEVLDNGKGIHPADLPTAIKRHATSKLASLEDLDRIATLGFRGEALPSVAAVSELSLLSRSVADGPAFELDLGARYLGLGGSGDLPADSAAEVLPDAQATTFGHFLGSPLGTRVRARGLFSQVPARLKFLKSQAAEVSQVREWMERLALTHPHVGFRLVSGERTVMNLRPQTEADRVRALLADGEDFPLVSWTSEDEPGSLPDGIKLRVHWLQGLSSPNTRKLAQVVNRRAVRDRLLQQSVLSAFRQALLPGQFPAIAIFLDVSPDRLDVNVHPTKTEVRFLDSGQIFRGIASRLETLIGRYGNAAFAGGSGNTSGTSHFPGHFGGGSAFSRAASEPWASGSPSDVLDRPNAGGFNWTPQAGMSSTPSAPTLWNFREAAVPENTTGIPVSQMFEHPFQPERYIGIVFQTYLFYDLGDELGLIDQHAAHERVRYEKLKARALGQTRAVQSQTLLLPEAVAFPSDRRSELEGRLEWLQRLGFEVEIFGEDRALVRAVPAEWGTDELRTRLKGLIDRTLEVSAEAAGTLAFDESLFERLASEACHSAIRAGDRIGPVEAAALITEMFKCEHPWNCPHGRPTVARIPRARFEEWFQRRV